VNRGRKPLYKAKQNGKRRTQEEKHHASNLHLSAILSMSYKYGAINAPPPSPAIALPSIVSGEKTTHLGYRYKVL